MSERPVIAGNYADFKLVKTRSVCQLVVEIPIEQAEIAVRMFGIPRGGAEIWVAVARLEQAPPKPVASPKERVRFHTLKPSAQAALKCEDVEFWEWLSVGDGEGPVVNNTDEAALAVRAACQVGSRSEFDSNPEAAARWQDLLRRYVDWRNHRTG